MSNSKLTVIRANAGSATLLAILTAAVIITVGVGFNWLVREHILASEGLVKKTEAMLLARSKMDEAIFAIYFGSAMPNRILVDESILGVDKLPVDGSSVEIAKGVELSVTDVGGLVSLASPRARAIEGLARAVGADGKRASIIADSVMDWVDRDDLNMLNGAERFYYSTHGADYTPRNMPMQSIEELKLVRGMDEELFNKMAPFLTIARVEVLNPNAASDEVLMADMGITEGQLKDLRARLVQGPISSLAELYAITGARPSYVPSEFGGFISSKTFHLEVRATEEDRVLYTVRAGLHNEDDLMQAPYSIIFWQEY